MARAIRVSLAAAGPGVPIGLNTSGPGPFSVALGGAIIGGALTYSIQFTLDDIYAPGYNPLTGAWIDVPNLIGLTANGAAALNFPAVAVRANVTAYTNGSLSFTVLQQG